MEGSKEGGGRKEMVRGGEVIFFLLIGFKKYYQEQKLNFKTQGIEFFSIIHLSMQPDGVNL